MECDITFNQFKVAEEDFPLDNMVALIKSRKVFDPVGDGKKAVNPTIEFVDAETYKVTGAVRPIVAQAFLDSRLTEDLSTTAAFTKKAALTHKSGKVSYELAAEGDYPVTDLLTYLHTNLGSLPEPPAPEEPEEEAPAEGEAQEEGGAEAESEEAGA